MTEISQRHLIPAELPGQIGHLEKVIDQKIISYHFNKNKETIFNSRSKRFL